MKLRNKKTGEIVDAWSFFDGCETINLKYFTSGGHEHLEYKSLTELNEDWEDYKPVEPLVEGMSQRAVLRAAARLSSTNAATVQRSDIAEIVIFDFGGQCRVELKDRGINVKNRGVYSIEELCGEEQE